MSRPPHGNPQSEDLTETSMLDGRLWLVQPRDGYRFSIDALLLADFVNVYSGMTVVDLGAGCGVVGLCLARRMDSGRVLAVEIQPRLAECARQGARVQKTGGGPVSVEVMEMDWNSLTPAMTGPVDQVVANPPYRRLGTGRMNPGGEEAAARHEVLGSLASAARTAARLLGKGGRLTVVYPSSRLGDLMAELNALKFQPKRLRMVHGRQGLPARLVLVEARAGGRSELRVDPPLFVFEKGRTYTSEVQDILSGWAWGAEP